MNLKIFVYLLSILVISPIVFSKIAINEIMYNPAGDDNNNEYIEVYGTNNLSNFTIEDSSSSDALKLLQYYNSDYSLIVEEGFNYSSIEASIYTVGATIGNNLNNDEDIIILKENGIIIDALSY